MSFDRHRERSCLCNLWAALAPSKAIWETRCTTATTWLDGGGVFHIADRMHRPPGSKLEPRGRRLGLLGGVPDSSMTCFWKPKDSRSASGIERGNSSQRIYIESSYMSDLQDSRGGRHAGTRCWRFAFIRAALVGQRVAVGPSRLAAPAADDEPLDTASGAGSLDEQIQPVRNRELFRQRESATRADVIAALTRPGSKAQRERVGLGVSKFRSIVRLRWRRND